MSKSTHTYRARPDFLLSPLAIRQSAEKIFQTYRQDSTFNIIRELNPWWTCYWSDSSQLSSSGNSLSFPGAFSRWGSDRVQVWRRNFWAGSFRKARTKLDLYHLFCWTRVLAISGLIKSTIPARYLIALRLGLASFYLFMDGHLSDSKAKPLQATARVCKICLSLNCSRHFRSAMRIPWSCGGSFDFAHATSGPDPSEEGFFRRGVRVVLWISSHRYGKKWLAAVITCGAWWFGGDLARKSQGGELILAIFGLFQSPGGLPLSTSFHSGWLTLWLSLCLRRVLNCWKLKIDGLAEYQQGLLFLDRGLISLKETPCSESHKQSRNWLSNGVDWRWFFWIVLVKEFAKSWTRALRIFLGESSWVELGGLAGKRRKTVRADSSPPLKIESDGTVFSRSLQVAFSKPNYFLNCSRSFPWIKILKSSSPLLKHKLDICATKIPTLMSFAEIVKEISKSSSYEAMRDWKTLSLWDWNTHRQGSGGRIVRLR